MGACFGKETKKPPQYHPDIRVVCLGPDFETPSIQVEERYQVTVNYNQDILVLLKIMRASSYYRKGEKTALLGDEASDGG